MASSDGNVSDSDDDMISCHICLLRFNTKNRKPKYLDCHHYFCLSCIQNFSKPNFVSCPICRKSTNLASRKIEQLMTNNIVLRLVAISKDRARERNELHMVEKEIMGQQLWCSECNISATKGCHKKKHAILSYFDIYTSHSLLLKSVISETNAACDRALEHYQKIHSAHQGMLARVSWLESKIVAMIESSQASVSHLESLKAKDNFEEVALEEDMHKTLSQINQLIVKISDRSDLAKAAELEAFEHLQTYCTGNDSAFLISLLKGEQGELPEGFDLNSSNSNVENGGELGDLLKKHCSSKDENIIVEEKVLKRDDYIEPRASCLGMKPELCPGLPPTNYVGMGTVNSRIAMPPPSLMPPPHMLPSPHMLPPPPILPSPYMMPPPNMMKHPPPIYMHHTGPNPTYNGNGIVGMPIWHSINRNNYH